MSEYRLALAGEHQAENAAVAVAAAAALVHAALLGQSLEEIRGDQ